MEPTKGKAASREKKGDCSPRVERQPAIRSARVLPLGAKLDVQGQEQGLSWQTKIGSPINHFALVGSGQQISH